MIEIKKKWGLVSTLYFDGEPFCDIHQVIFGKHPKFSPSDNLDQWFSALEYKKAKEYALRRLAKESLSSFTIKKALKERCVSGETIDRLIAYLNENLLINDEEWISNFVKSYQKRLGAKAILQKCYLKGIPKERVEPYLKGDEKSAIKHLVATRYKSYDFKDPKLKQKVIRSLAFKGFSFDEILEVLSCSE